MAVADFGYFGVGIEDVEAEGVAVAPTHFYPFSSIDFQVSDESVDWREIRGTRQGQQVHEAGLSTNASMSGAVYPAGAFGIFMAGLVGAVESSTPVGATLARKHTFVDSDALRSLSFERADAIVASSSSLLAERLPGCKIEGIDFSCAFGEQVTADITAQGLSFPVTPPSRPVKSTVVYPGMNPLLFRGAKIFLDGEASPYFKNLDFGYTNTLELQQTLRGTREAYALNEAGIEATLSGMAVFKDLVLYNKFKNSEEIDVLFTATGDIIEASTVPDADPIRYELGAHWGKVKVSSYGVPFEAGSVINADVEFRVTFDFEENKLFDVWIINKDVAGTYN